MNPSLLSDDDFYPLIEARHSDPFRILGLREFQGRWLMRVLRPDAAKVEALGDNGQRFELAKIHEGGLFELALPGVQEAFSYTLRFTGHGGDVWAASDPYAFGPVLGEMDVYLFNEGTHYDIYKKLGAHVREMNGVPGVHFAVWAPSAQRVSVAGDFNGWDGRIHPMRKLVPAGVWEIFLPGVHEGAHYKFEIRGPQGDVTLKTDPYAFFAQHTIETGCMVFDLERYTWSDSVWMEARRTREPYASPMSIYEVHLGSWQRVAEDGGRYLSYLELGDTLLPYVKEMGFTHIELMPVMEHPFDGSWGYQVVNYYAATSRFGNPDEFRNFIDRCHQAGIGIILDWVPGHFPKDAHGLAKYDGTCLYEHADPRLGEHMDWGTLIFNYGRNEVKNFLIGNALFWMDEYHIDGMRVDAVASMLYLDYSRKEGEWIPNELGGRENLEAVAMLKKLNESVSVRYPHSLMIAEESTSWPMVSRPTSMGGLGFDLKWDLGWMHDSLRYLERDPIHRRFHHNEITFRAHYAFHENFVMPLSHDEVVHGKGSILNKMPGDRWQKFANVRLLLASQMVSPGKKLLFMGTELGQWREWDHDSELDWTLLDDPSHAGLSKLVGALNQAYREVPALHQYDCDERGFRWVDGTDSDQGVLAFLRIGEPGTRPVLVVSHYTPTVRANYPVGVPLAGHWTEILNTDARAFGGSDVLNGDGANAFAEPLDGFDQRILVTLAPLACSVWLGPAEEGHRDGAG